MLVEIYMHNFLTCYFLNHVLGFKMSEFKNIQTKIDKALYARLKHLTEIEGLSIKEIVKRAITEYLQRREGEVKKDPIFNLVGSFETREGNWSERKDWR